MRLRLVALDRVPTSLLLFHSTTDRPGGWRGSARDGPAHSPLFSLHAPKDGSVTVVCVRMAPCFRGTPCTPYTHVHTHLHSHTLTHSPLDMIRDMVMCLRCMHVCDAVQTEFHLGVGMVMINERWPGPVGSRSPVYQQHSKATCRLCDGTRSPTCYIHRTCVCACSISQGKDGRPRICVLAYLPLLLSYAEA